MSDKQEAKPEAATAGKGKKKKLIIIIVATVLLLGGGGGAAAFFLMGKKADDKAHGKKDGKDSKDAKNAKEAKEDAHAAADDAEEEDSEEEAAPPAPPPGTKAAVKKKKRKPFDPAHAPVFVDLEPFTVNLADAPEPRMMQVRLTLEVKDTAAGDALKTLMPAVRNDILLLLGSRHAAEMATRDGKEALGSEIAMSTNVHLKGSKFAKSVTDVHFQQLIIQ